MRLHPVLLALVFALPLASISMPVSAAASVLALLRTLDMPMWFYGRNFDLLDLGGELGEHIVISRVTFCALELILSIVEL